MIQNKSTIENNRRKKKESRLKNLVEKELAIYEFSTRFL